MGVALRPMTLAEVEEFARESRDTYVASATRSGEPARVARERVEEQHEQYFPDGVPAPGHRLWVVESDGAPVARVWVGPDPRRRADESVAWLNYIEVAESSRGRGVGTAALAAVEAELERDGIIELGLNVYGDNTSARRLYTAAGYEEITITMVKNLG